MAEGSGFNTDRALEARGSALATRGDLTLFDVIAAIHDLAADDAQASTMLQTLLRTGAVRRRGPRR